jgi:Homing endonuclease associated repeat
MKFELKPHNRDVPDDGLISDLKRVAAEINKDGVTIEEYKQRGRFHATTLIRRFGSWFKALEKAGLAKTRNFYADVPNEKLSADLKRVAGELGKSSATQDEYNERGHFRSGLLCDRFGSWFKALESAGLAKTRNLNIPNEELFNNLADVWTKLERQPSYNDLTSQTSKFSSGTYEKRFELGEKHLRLLLLGRMKEKRRQLKPLHSQARKNLSFLRPRRKHFATAPHEP